MTCQSQWSSICRFTCNNFLLFVGPGTPVLGGIPWFKIETADTEDTQVTLFTVIEDSNTEVADHSHILVNSVQSCVQL